ncbi:hypothetical protein R1flu_013079 [Riccia fluitans]|uniref:Uncharacterized protein n=1 Tax=Riccia fluitans TaxID=41844 RepID=A0ABD1ZCG2_9MARC
MDGGDGAFVTACALTERWMATAKILGMDERPITKRQPGATKDKRPARSQYPLVVLTFLGVGAVHCCREDQWSPQ